MEIRRRNQITIGVLMSFGINMMLGAIVFGAAMFIGIFTAEGDFNPRWSFAFPFVMLFITGIVTGLAVMFLRAGKIAGAFIGFVCGVLVTGFFVFLMPEWTVNEGAGIGRGSASGALIFGWFFMIAALGIINAISGVVAGMRNKAL